MNSTSESCVAQWLMVKIHIQIHSSVEQNVRRELTVWWAATPRRSNCTTGRQSSQTSGTGDGRPTRTGWSSRPAGISRLHRSSRYSWTSRIQRPARRTGRSWYQRYDAIKYTQDNGTLTYEWASLEWSGGKKGEPQSSMHLLLLTEQDKQSTSHIQNGNTCKEDGGKVQTCPYSIWCWLPSDRPANGLADLFLLQQKSLALIPVW